MAAQGKTAGRRRSYAVILAMVVLAGGVDPATGSPAQEKPFRVRIPRWPCRLVVRPTLLGVIEDGWERSPTLRRQCEVLADAGAVVALEWGSMPDSQSRALAHMDRRQGLAVARIIVPNVPDVVELVAHELQHVIELANGLDYETESQRPGSGVWRAFAGFETTAAIEAGRQVGKELRETPRASRPSDRGR